MKSGCSGHCHNKEPEKDTPSCHAGNGHKRFDWLLWGSGSIIIVFYALYLFGIPQHAGITDFEEFSHSVYDLMNTMWWGLLLAIIFVSILSGVPDDVMFAVLGKGGTFSGIVRATLAGVLLDLCSHGILLVGMKLYQKGASLGQTMAFLIASPWNSLSLTMILWSLIGLEWTIAFLLLSMVIAVISGFIFDRLVGKKVLPENPNTHVYIAPRPFTDALRAGIHRKAFTLSHMGVLLKEGITGSRMILRWIFFGVVLASLIRTFVSTDQFATFFGATLGGLGLTIIAATIIEVCSEGSTPIAADLVTRAKAPGNGFAFLMTGVSTDYTEIMSLKETTSSWKIALFLPLVTVPQIVLVAWVINLLAT